MAASAAETSQTFLELIGEVRGDSSRNIHDGACDHREQAGSYVLVISLIMVLVLKLRLFGVARILPQSFQPTHKAIYYPVSILICVGVASILEAELKVCLLVSAFGDSTETTVVIKSVTIAVSAFLIQVMAYYYLGLGEKGEYLFCCGRDKKLKLPKDEEEEEEEMDREIAEDDTNSRASSALFIPNIIAYIRILLLFSAVVALHWQPIDIFGMSAFTIPEILSAGDVSFVFLWLLSCSLDFIDGCLARRLDQCSRLGEILDVVCDNLARTAMWFAVASVRPKLAPCAMFFTSLEWLTFAAVQILSANRHWKDQSSESVSSTSTSETPPQVVVYFFSNNFCNPLGLLGFVGLYGLPLFLFLEPTVEYWLRQTVQPWAASIFLEFDLSLKLDADTMSAIMQKYVSSFFSWSLYAGRIVSAGVECHFCQSFFVHLARKGRSK